MTLRILVNSLANPNVLYMRIEHFKKNCKRILDLFMKMQHAEHWVFDMGIDWWSWESQQYTADWYDK